METIHLKTHQSRLIQNLKHAFNQSSMLGELLQNARRAQAQTILIVADDSTITIADDGIGIEDLQTLIHIAESGWDAELQARENAFGMGVLSTLYFSERLSVHSRERSFEAPTVDIMRGADIAVSSAPPLSGTLIRLYGVRSPVPEVSLVDWVRSELTRLCEAFPTPVYFNGTEVPRPLMKPTLPWRDTEVGRILVNLSRFPTHWRAFLQGLPLGTHWGSGQHVILLRDDIMARLPDRQSLLTPETDGPKIMAAVNRCIREELRATKQTLGGKTFIEGFGEYCLTTDNGDLLNDIPYACGSWFRDWEGQPPGHCRDNEEFRLPGVIEKQTLQADGIWTIDDLDEPENFAAEAYIAARDGYLLQTPQLPQDHWLLSSKRSISTGQLTTCPGTTLHQEAFYASARRIELIIVESLTVKLEGDDSEYAVPAIHANDAIYLTPQAQNVTRLIQHYIYDNFHREDWENEDAERIATFQAIAIAKTPSDVIWRLLPESLTHDKHSKLANATIHLSFDDEGKLKTVTSA